MFESKCNLVNVFESAMQSTSSHIMMSSYSLRITRFNAKSSVVSDDKDIQQSQV